MRNLAGDPKCDSSIIDELQAAGVERVKGEKTGREVDASVSGKLGSFTFRRAWYYWVVEGPTPLHVAEEMYKNPIGRTEVRCGGHCGCPAPADYGVAHYDAAGKMLLPLDGPDYKLIQAKPWSAGLADILAGVEQKCRFVENPRLEATSSIVDCYHIDSAEGLRLFVDTIRKYGLDRATTNGPQEQ
jgi:hypothetical protein